MNTRCAQDYHIIPSTLNNSYFSSGDQISYREYTNYSK